MLALNRTRRSSPPNQEAGRILLQQQKESVLNSLCSICLGLNVRERFNKQLELDDEDLTERSLVDEVLLHELLDEEPRYNVLTAEDFSDEELPDGEAIDQLYSEEELGTNSSSSVAFSGEDSESSSNEGSMDGLLRRESLSSGAPSEESFDSDDVVRITFGDEEIAAVFAPGMKVLRKGAERGDGSTVYLGSIDDILKKRQSCSLCRLISRALFNDRAVLQVPSPKQQHQCSGTMWKDCLEITFGECTRMIRLLKDHHHSAVIGSATLVSREPQNSSIPWPEFDIHIVGSWLKDCESRHGGACSDQIPIERYQVPVALTLIDVERRCLVKGQSSWRFFALSYVWGGASVLQTTRENRQALEEDGALSSEGPRSASIATVIKDAMHLISLLSERYLWVDSLCIVQDDDENKYTQIAQMDIIYSYSVMTIVQLSGNNANTGLSGLYPNPTRVRAMEVVEDLPLTWMPPGLEAALSESVYDSRGWTFQERLFSKRCVYFSDERVYFNCRLGDRWEDEDKMQTQDIKHFAVDKKRLNPLANSPALMWPKDYREEWYEFLNLYSRLVGMYSVRNLSFSSDVLVAFSGVKAGLEHCFEANFIFGLPEAIFDVALMWRPSGWIDRRDRTAMICFPSWCWTGWVGKIHYSFDSRDLYDKDNESSKFKVLSEIESFQIYNQGTFRTIERHKSTYHNRPNPKAPFSPPTAVDNNLNRGVLQFSAFIVPAKYFHIKRYDSSGFSIGKPGSIALISVEDEVRGYLYDGGVLKSKSLKHDSFEFVLLSRVSRPFEERTFFEGFEKFEWDIVNVLVVEWKGLYAERVAVGFMHASLWEKSYTTRKFIRLA